MKNNIRKRGQRYLRKFSRVSIEAQENSKEHIKENFIGRLSHIANIRLLIVEWVLLITALVFLAVAQAFWFGDSYSTDTFGNGGTYIEATLGDVKSMNPLFATTSSEKALSRLMFSTLSAVDYHGHIGIGLAQSISHNEDGKVWTVKLRDNLKWSDGEPITNKDVLFTAELIKNPAVSTIYDSNLAKVKVTESEDGNIVFSLPSAYADFVTALEFPIVPEHVLGDADPRNLIEDNFSNTPVTSGAFMFNATQTTGLETEKVFYLSVNPNYYKGSPLLNSFAVHTYDTKDAIVEALNNGSVTATAELSDAESKKVSATQFIEKKSSLNSGVFVFFNTKREIVNNPELRAAIRQGINLDTIRAEAPETTAIDFPLLTSQIKLSRYPELPKSDSNTAKTKITELLGEKDKHMEIVTVNTGFLPKIAEALKNELQSLGFEPELVTYDENQDFINSIISKRSYDVLVYETPLGTDPDLLPYYHSSQANSSGLNLSNYRNVMVDDLLLGARDVMDSELRIKKYESFLDYWASEVPAISLYQPNLTYYYNKNVRSFGDDVKLVTALDRFSDINSWAVSHETKNKTP